MKRAVTTHLPALKAALSKCMKRANASTVTELLPLSLQTNSAFTMLSYALLLQFVCPLSVYSEAAPLYSSEQSRVHGGEGGRIRQTARIRRSGVRLARAQPARLPIRDGLGHIAAS